MNKKIISLASILALIMCVTLLTVTTVFAVSNKGISSSAETVEREGNIVVIFTIGAQTKDASELSLKFTFDNSAFELTDYTVPEIIGAEKSVLDTQKANHITASNANGYVAFGYNSSDGEASIALSEVYATFTFKAKPDAAFGSYSFTVIDYDIGSLDKSGLPTAICDISSLTASEKIASVKVAAHTDSETSVRLNKDTLTLNSGTTETLVATVNAAGKTVTWDSDDESVAKVDSTGNVTAVKKGIATITATVDGKKDVCIVTVNCGHDFVKNANEQYLVSTANCESPAVYYRSCSKCGERDTSTFTYGDKNPENHIEASEWIIDKEATESEVGSKHKECIACGAVLETAEIEKTASNSDSDGNIFLWIILAVAIIVGGVTAIIVLVRKNKSDKR